MTYFLTGVDSVDAERRQLLRVKSRRRENAATVQSSDDGHWLRQSTDALDHRGSAWTADQLHPHRLHFTDQRFTTLNQVQRWAG